MERVCMYLRKSRADLEAEARGEGETLAKHRKALLKIAKEKNINVVKIREEIVSGESLAFRPQMLELLQEVEQGKYDAVLCMDMDRLGRGNMKEQGLILETFQMTNTKIITPRKTYDLNDEWDEEYSEFEAFMARKELKIINRRLQGGRIRSVEEGNYIGTRPPYGYNIHKDSKERYLVPHPEQAPVVKMIFEWYTHDDPKQRMGSSKIANKLNELGYRTYSGIEWKPSSVLTILKNAVYIGRLQWKKKERKKSTDPNKNRDTRTRPKAEWIDVKGKHKPLVSADTYYKAQEILKEKYHVPYQLENGITNPLAGLIRCGHCGASMILRPYTDQKPHIKCYNDFCQSKSSRFEYVEGKLIAGLQLTLDQFKAQWRQNEMPKNDNKNVITLKENAVKSLEKEKSDLEKQIGNLHDLLEKGIYDVDTYLERSKTLADRLNKVKFSLSTAKKELEEELNRETAQKNIIPKLENVLKIYNETDEPQIKNNLLKSVLEKAVYKKEKIQRDDDFDLSLYIKASTYTDKQ
ncbi:recombinase family protein [Fictibacillus sp. Mic-4]|uniref:recombinase family protein n=1 Tax=Fictibacillus sp. Mic-4 TaxID=3132826 RepID=UPI003CF189E7